MCSKVRVESMVCIAQNFYGTFYWEQQATQFLLPLTAVNSQHGQFVAHFGFCLVMWQHVADMLLLQMDDGGAAGVDERFLGHQASQRFGADLLKQQKGKVRSGDDDLSAKLPLSQRRAKLDGVKAKQAAR